MKVERYCKLFGVHMADQNNGHQCGIGVISPTSLSAIRHTDLSVSEMFHELSEKSTHSLL